MMIRNMFADDINRKINGVIKVDQAGDDVIEQELNEYVITKELKKHFANLMKQPFCLFLRAFLSSKSQELIWSKD